MRTIEDMTKEGMTWKQIVAELKSWDEETWQEFKTANNESMDLSFRPDK